jgi:hypothetical protein
MNIDLERGTGRTRQQLIDAPYGAIYIWPVSHSVGYVKQLAMSVNRGDLEFRFPSILDYLGELCSMQKLTGVIIDHACELTKRQCDNLEIVKGRI